MKQHTRPPARHLARAASWRTALVPALLLPGRAAAPGQSS